MDNQYVVLMHIEADETDVLGFYHTDYSAFEFLFDLSFTESN